MRLLNTSTITLHEFNDSNRPPYAILSHRWEEEEVTYQDIVTGSGPSRLGYKKLVNFCNLARAGDYEYCWMDTCCIDKSSSAELSESINSMYTWYQKADVCYAYLSDVEPQEDPALPESTFRLSEWFSRGWTLQELLAPLILYFYDSEWNGIGSRTSLLGTVSEITRIDSDYFATGNLSKYSIAQKMSWASRRQTTRIEDGAYCLLGIFGINMPLLYGEGDAAFRRFQEEVIKRSADDSILAWASGNRHQSLAKYLFQFEESGCIQRNVCHPNAPTTSQDISITSTGIQITLGLINVLDAALPASETVSISGQTFGLLRCGTKDKRVALRLRPLGGGVWERQSATYSLIDLSRVDPRSVKVERVVLRHSQIELQTSWNTWQMGAEYETATVEFPDPAVTGFKVWAVDTSSQALQFPTKVELSRPRFLTLRWKPYIVFSDSKLRGFALAMGPSLSSANATLYTNLDIPNDSGERQYSILPCYDESRDRISACHAGIEGDVVMIKATPRRRRNGWLVQLSISPYHITGDVNPS